jgi:hypothetical protein
MPVPPIGVDRPASHVLLVPPLPGLSGVSGSACGWTGRGRTFSFVCNGEA